MYVPHYNEKSWDWENEERKAHKYENYNHDGPDECLKRTYVVINKPCSEVLGLLSKQG